MNLEIILTALLMVVGGVLVVGLIVYIFDSIALYRLAEHRGIANAWLAWIPVGRSYILGAIGDHIEAWHNASKTYFRYIMLGCAAAVLLFSGIGQTLELTGSLPLLLQEQTADTALLRNVFVSSSLGFVGSVAALALTVLEYMTAYKIYKCHRPEHATLWTVLSIVFPLLKAFFLFAVRNTPPVGAFESPYPPGGWQPPNPYGWQPPQDGRNPDGQGPYEDR